ncbi:MAG: nuclear transport factor 2 family protein [Terriglobales bacterium]
MHFRTAASTLALLAAMITSPACTFYGEHPARTMAEATGGEGLERVFWKNIAAGNWDEIDRSLSSNYVGIASGGNLDHAAALDQYRQWQLKSYSIGDLKTELSGTTIIVTYSITLNGTAAAQPLPSTPQRMMTVWQQQKRGWVVIAHSTSQ